MPSILVIEQDVSYAERIAEALRPTGQEIDIVSRAENVLSYTANRHPLLVLASANFPDAKQILGRFSRRQGGPGAIVMIPINLLGEVTVEDFQADALLPKPFSSDDLTALVEQLLADKSPPPRPKVGLADLEDTQQLTSEDIFGDVLAEVEAEIRPSSRAAARPSTRQDVDLEHRLEQTLSGVLDLTSKRHRGTATSTEKSLSELGIRSPTRNPAASASRRMPLYTEDEVDQLLDKTLSSLRLPTRQKSRADHSSAIEVDNEARTTAQTAAAPEREIPKLDLAQPTFGTTDAKSAEPSMPAEATALNPSEISFEPFPGTTDDFAELALEPPMLEAADSAIPAASPAPAPKPLTPEDLAHGDEFRTQRLPLLFEPQDQPDGVPFGEYSLMRRIAVGGMAEVWQARRRGVEGFQKTVAIKKILSHLTESSDFVNMFIDEAKLVAQLNHNNIIQIYDLGKVGPDFFIAMEYVDGKDLRSILTAGREQHQPLPTGLALMIAARLARALDYAHRKRDFDNQALGLVHRDVSPQNVLISFEGEIKLCDFGIVKAVAKASTTQMGALKGKLQYMSPEQAWGRSVDSRSDIFSLGSVLFEMLTGTKLFTAESEVGVLDAVRGCHVSPPSSIVPSIPSEVDRIVLKMLAKSPDERYQTAGEMEQETESVLQNLQPRPGEAELTLYLQQLFADDTSTEGTLSPASQALLLDSTSPSTSSEADFRESRAFSSAVPMEEQESVSEAPLTAFDETGSGPAELESGEFEEAALPSPETEAGDEIDGDRKTLTSRLSRIALVLLVLALLAAIVFFVLTRQERQGTRPTASSAASAPASDIPANPPDTVGSEEPVAYPATAAADGADDATNSTATEIPPAGDGTVDSSASESLPTEIPPNLEKIVEEELSKRAEQIRKDLETQKKQLEAELEKARSTEEAAADDSGGTGSSEEPSGDG